MQKITLSLVLLLFAACSSGGGGGSSAPGTVGHYGTFGKPLPGGEVSEDPNYKPRGLQIRTFSVGGVDYAPIDIDTEDLTIDVDPATQTVKGHATLNFKAQSAGHPYLLLSGTVTSARLDGTTVAASQANTPVSEQVITFDRAMTSGEQGTLEIEYTLPSTRFGWGDGGVGFLTDMSDMGVHFFERYGPANYEDDPFQLTLTLKVAGATSKSYSIFANGEVETPAEGVWKITYPKHYTSSSIYAHLTNRKLFARAFDVQGMERSIPVMIYGSDEAQVNAGADLMQKLMTELEGDYGPYAHPGFIAYITASGGGMEYVGATITSVWALPHELFHSWFARGVMPAEGRSGWIDEGLASWRDNGYKRATSLLSRTPTSFDNVSIFDRNTPSRAYADGRAMFAELDDKFASRGGLRPVLKKIFAKYKMAVVTNQEFEDALEETTATNLSGYFARYVSGENVASPAEAPDLDPRHPRPLTEEDLQDLR